MGDLESETGTDETKRKLLSDGPRVVACDDGKNDSTVLQTIEGCIDGNCTMTGKVLVGPLV